jgi:hypothetical protein
MGPLPRTGPLLSEMQASAPVDEEKRDWAPGTPSTRIRLRFCLRANPLPQCSSGHAPGFSHAVYYASMLPSPESPPALVDWIALFDDRRPAWSPRRTSGPGRSGLYPLPVPGRPRTPTLKRVATIAAVVVAHCSS